MPRRSRLNEKSTRAYTRKQVARDDPGGSDTPFPIEHRIVRETMDDLHELEFDRGASLSKTTEEFEKLLGGLPDDETVHALFEPPAAQFRHAMELSSAPLARAISDERRAERDYRVFCRQNGLSRPAEFPKNQTIYWLAPTVLTVGFESLLNAGLFGQHLKTGILGALALSGGVSFLNVSLAHAGATLTRNCLHCLPGRRLLARVGVAVVAGLVLLLHLIYARFRTVLQENGGKSSGDFFYHFLGRGFDLNFPGLLLLGLGAGAAAALWYRAYKSDDPYPSFGAVERRRRAAQKRADQARSGLTETRIAVAATARAAVERTLEQYAEALDKLRSCIFKIQAIEDAFETLVPGLRRRLAEGLAVFWDEFHAVSGGAPCLRAKDIPEVRSNVTRTDTSEYQRRLDEAQHALPLRRDLAMKFLLGLDAWMEKRVAALLAGVEAAALGPEPFASPSKSRGFLALGPKES